MNHVTQAEAWVKQMGEYAAEHDQESLIEVEVVEGVGHNLGKLTRAGMSSLVKAIKHDKRVQAEKKKKQKEAEKQRKKRVELSNMPTQDATRKRTLARLRLN